MIKMKVRFDYIADGKSSRRLFGSKSGEEQAEELRQHKVASIRNMPIQGISIIAIDMNLEVYTIYDEITNRVVACAPVCITIHADTLEDAIKFAMKEEFRTVEVLEPQEINLSRIEVERLLAKISEGLQNYRSYLEKKMDHWK